jgi:hypothetical protein
VVRRDYASHPRIRELVSALQNRLQILARGCQDVQMLNPDARSAVAVAPQA